MPCDGPGTNFQIFVVEEKYKMTENSPNNSYVYLKKKIATDEYSEIVFTVTLMKRDYFIIVKS